MVFSKILQGAMAIAIVSGSFVVSPVPVFAQSDTAEAAKRRVNLAGRQRMLSQRMSKDACFVFAGVETERHLEELSATMALFTETNEALRYGSEALGLPEEVHLPVIAGLVDVTKDWEGLRPRMQGILDGTALDAENVAGINAAGLVLLADMNSTVGLIASSYGEKIEDLPLILAITIDLAGRQRMFTQRMAKDFCLVDAGVDVEASRADLAETRQYFNATLDALMVGFAGAVIPPPNAEIADKLQEVKDLWLGPDTVLAAVADGAAVSDADRRIIVDGIEKVLVAMNEAVNLYEKVTELP